MKFFKKPFFAFLLAVVVVLVSTLVSVDVKLSRKCEKVTAGFYDGIVYKGELQPAPADCIRVMCADAEAMVLKAGNYGIDTEELVAVITELKQSIISETSDLETLFEDFNSFYSGTLLLENQLNNASLSERHQAELAESFEEFELMAKELADSGYNDSVQVFLKKFDRFPVRQFAELLNIEFPAYFF